MTKIFVYGTLKKDYHNHYIIENETYIGKGTLKKENRFKMVSMGAFPAIVPATVGEAKDIEGEIWDICENGFKKVDLLEGFPVFYWRDQFNIDAEDRRHLCWVYYLQHQKAKNMHLPEVANF